MEDSKNLWAHLSSLQPPSASTILEYRRKEDPMRRIVPLFTLLSLAFAPAPVYRPKPDDTMDRSFG